MVSFNPSLIMFSGKKDKTTERNILSTGSFSVNLVDSIVVPKIFSCISVEGAERIDNLQRFKKTSKHPLSMNAEPIWNACFIKQWT